MPHIHYDQVMADTVTGTQGALTEVGTITTSADATDVLGFWVQGAKTGTSTAAEGTQVFYSINARSLLPEIITAQDSWTTAGLAATNHEASLSYGKFMPIMPNNVVLGNRRITCSADQGIEATVDHAAQFGVMFAEGAYPTDAMRNRDKIMTRFRWSGTFNDEDIGNATSEAFANSLTIPGWLKEIVAIEINYTHDGVATAAEHRLGHVEFSGTIPGLFPMQYPFPAIGGGLGTAVSGQPSNRSIIMPAYIKLPGVDSTLNATGVIQAVLTGVGVLQVTIYAR